MSLPPRVYFTLHEASARWGCNIADIAGWADAGKFRILTGISAIRCGDEIVGGKVVLSPMELMPLFRRCGTGPTEGIMRRIQMLNRPEWLLITDPVGGIVVAVVDLMIRAEEVHAVEDENEMGRRVAAGPRVSTSYDWEGMNIALILRIFDHGLPDTQADLVAKMQEWFSDRSEGKKMPDSRSIRRRITLIWRALRREEA